MKGKKIVVLCEDQQHKVFINHFLVKRKITRKRRYNLAPTGEGAGEQYVREQYPKELEAARKNDNLLLVMIDADNRSDDRMRQLDKACIDVGVSPRKESDAVGIFIPDPAIETWLDYLKNGKYHKTNFPKKCKPQAEYLAQMCKKKALLKNAPDSLQNACKEWEKLQ